VLKTTRQRLILYIYFAGLLWMDLSLRNIWRWSNFTQHCITSFTKLFTIRENPDDFRTL